MCRLDVKNVVFLKHAEHAERSCHLVQRDSASIFLLNWYRPPGSDLEAMDSLPLEIAEASTVSEDIVVCGDLNVHHRR